VSALAGRGAVVTGGGRGLGAAVARALAKAGAAVCLAARSMPELEEVAQAIREEGRDAMALHCDVSDPHSIESMLRDAAKALDGIDILVNNAGVAPSNPLRRLTLEEWNRTFMVNVTGAFLCTKGVWEPMIERGWGRIVNMASVAGLVGGKYIAAYSASKHAMVGFTRSIALEAAGTGVTVNAVCPSYVDTPLLDAALERISEVTGSTAEEALARLLQREGQPRLVTVEEVARAVVRLCEDPAANGECIVLDGRGEE